MLRTNRHQIHHVDADVRLNPEPPTSSLSHQPQPSAAAGTHQPIKTKAKLFSFLLQALIMALAASLFYFSTGLVIIMILFHLCLLSGALRRRCNRRHNHHYLLDFDSDIDNTAPRLSPAKLKKLPRTRLARGSEDACAICLEDLIGGDWCRELPDCKHAFHACCVDRWLAKAVICPVCRTTVEIAAEEQPSEMGERGGQLWSVFDYE